MLLESLRAPSICNLSLSDTVPLLFTLQSAFTDSTTAGESICGALDVARGCYFQWTTSRPCLRALVADFRLLYGATLPKGVDWAVKAARYVQKIGQILNWDSQGLRYFGCIVDWVDAGDSGTVSILLAVRDNYNCLVSSVQSSRKRRSTYDLDAVVVEFQNAVGNGSLLIQDDGMTLYVTGMAQCDPPACANGTAMSVTAPPTPTPIPPPPPPPAIGSTLPQTAVDRLLIITMVIVTSWLARAVPTTIVSEGMYV